MGQPKEIIFAKGIRNIPLPEMLTIAGRDYDFVCPIDKTERCLDLDTLLARAKAMRAHLGEDDVKHILKYQAEIPVEFRHKIIFLFTDYEPPASNKGSVAGICWGAFNNETPSYWAQEWFDSFLLWGVWETVCLLRRRRQ